MPWKVFPQDGQFCVHKLTPDGMKGAKVACHATMAQAQAQMRALHANEPMMKAEIAKVDEDEGLVFGWAWVSDSGGELLIDSHGESIEPVELEKAAYDYVLEARAAGQMHEGEALGRMVESLVLSPQKAEAMGLGDIPGTGWWVGFKVDDPATFAKVKDGTFAMFSIQGFAEETADV